jgi:hypothetical protein
MSRGLQWDDLTRETKNNLLRLAENLLKAELGTGRPACCAACYYWRAWQPIEDSLKSGGHGECRCRPPHRELGFPITRADDWCGESYRLTTTDLAWRIWDERRKQPEKVK